VRLIPVIACQFAKRYWWYLSPKRLGILGFTETPAAGIFARLGSLDIDEATNNEIAQLLRIL